MDSLLRNGVPQSITVHRAIASGPAERHKRRTICGCLYDSTGSKIGLSERRGGVGGDLVSSVNGDVVKVWRDERVLPDLALYLGHFMGSHYGHFLVETLSTAWATAEFGSIDRFVFHPFIFGTEIRPFMEPIFAALGIDPAKIYIITDRVVFERIIVPERLMDIFPRGAHLRMRSIYRTIRDAVASPSGPPSRRAYLSRSRLPPSRLRIANEDEVEEVFANAGFEIWHPQDLSIEQQIALYSQCAVLAGLSGSALHNVVFCQPGTTVINLHTPPGRPPVSWQTVCNALAEAQYVGIPFVSNHAENALSIEALRRELSGL